MGAQLRLSASLTSPRGPADFPSSGIFNHFHGFVVIAASDQLPLRRTPAIKPQRHDSRYPLRGRA